MIFENLSRFFWIFSMIFGIFKVSSWIKNFIQSQESEDKRRTVILASIRCAITCWNIGNFNSSREIWLGLKTALVNQNEDIPGMSFLNLAFDSLNFVKPSHQHTLSKKVKASANKNKSEPEQQTLAISSSNINRNYSSKTQLYCEAVSRALDIPNCKVVPFFGSFLHDLRQLLETIPSRIMMCNKTIQRPIEVISDNWSKNQLNFCCI